MTSGTELRRVTLMADWVVLDTNVWIFGLRRQEGQMACQRLLRVQDKITSHFEVQLYHYRTGEI